MDSNAIEFDLKHFYISREPPKPRRSFLEQSPENLCSAKSDTESESDCKGKNVILNNKENVPTCGARNSSSVENKEKRPKNLLPVLCMVRSKRPRNRVGGVLLHRDPNLPLGKVQEKTMAVRESCTNYWSTMTNNGPKMYQDHGIERLCHPGAHNGEDHPGVDTCEQVPNSSLQHQDERRSVQFKIPQTGSSVTNDPTNSAGTERECNSFSSSYRSETGKMVVGSRLGQGCSEQMKESPLSQQLAAASSTGTRLEMSSASNAASSSDDTDGRSPVTSPVESRLNPSPGNEPDSFVKYITIKLMGGSFLHYTTKNFLTYRDLTSLLNGRPKKMTFNAYGNMIVEVFDEHQSRQLLQTKLMKGLNVCIYPHATLNTIRGFVVSKRLWNDGTEADVVTQLKHEGVCEATTVETIKTVNGSLIFTAQVKFDQRTRLPSFVTTLKGLRLTVQWIVTAPRRCIKCFQFDHESFKCRLQVGLCENCLKPASDHPQPCERKTRCANCSSQHGSLSTKCFVFYKTWRRDIVCATQSIGVDAATQMVEEEIVECQKKGLDYCKEYPILGTV